jgi:uncharacterized membrane protein
MGTGDIVWSDFIQALLRWAHIIAGITWIGHLYFFNWVNGPFTGTLDKETKQKVVPELMPRALFWFRWGAAWTWITGFFLLALVYYHPWRQMMFEPGPDAAWSAGAGVMVATRRSRAAGWPRTARSCSSRAWCSRRCCSTPSCTGAASAIAPR